MSKILKLESENVKRIRAIEISPDPEDGVVLVGGKNAQGKSSVLDSIMYALAGNRSIPSEPIRKGEDRAEVKVTLDDITITRVITHKTDRLEVKGSDGKKFTKPQAILDELVSRLTFDPLAFARLGSTAVGIREQTAIVKELAEIDFTELDEELQDLQEEKRDVGRDLKKARAILEDTPEPEETPEGEVVVSDLLAAIKEGNDINSRYQDIVDSLAERERAIIDSKAEIERLEKEILDYKKDIEIHKAEIEEEKKDLQAIEPVDVEALEEKLQDAERINRTFAQAQDFTIARDNVVTCEDRVKSISKEIQEIESKKKELVSSAKMPIDDLGINDLGEITFAGVPFTQCSSAEQLKISVAIGISLNPKLRIMLIRDGSLLDDDNLEIVKAIAKEYDAQIWIEVVREDETCNVIIEDGSIKEVN